MIKKTVIPVMPLAHYVTWSKSALLSEVQFLCWLNERARLVEVWQVHATHVGMEDIPIQSPLRHC
jgi:hypothetical protein